tara:strand:+ start:141 stop:503 length:363 start_codon:yes stop_codon:yes gene_type:complete
MIGCFVLFQWGGMDLIEDGGVLIALPFAYLFGLLPALMASIFNGILIIKLKNEKPETSLLFSIFIGGLSGLLSGVLCFLVLRNTKLNIADFNLLVYFSVFVVPAAACGIINKESWRQLNT